MEFPTTFWSVIREACRDPQGARERVVRRYWRPIYEYFRLKGSGHEDAEDLTQGVFLNVCHESFLERADRSKGRFRSLLLAVANHVRDSWLRGAYAEKRAGDRQPLPLDPAVLELADSRAALPSAEFDRMWAESLMQEALSRLAPEFREAVQRHYVGNQSYDEIARALGKSWDAVKNLIQRGKERLRQLLREVVSEYASSSAEVEDELRDLRAWLGQARG